MRHMLKILFRKVRRSPGYLIMLAVVVVVAYSILQPGDWNPKHRRGLILHSSSLELAWQGPDLWLPAAPAVDDKAVYLYYGNSTALVARDLRTGEEFWSHTSTPTTPGEVVGHTFGTTSVLSDGESVYTLTSTTASAFSPATGVEMWSTELGGGHVRVVPQLAPATLRIYYGDTIFDLDPRTGQVVHREDSTTLIWRTQGLDLVQHPPILLALESATAREVWRSYIPSLEVSTIVPPVDLPDATLAPIETGHLCRLSLTSGEFEWCTENSPTSNAAAVVGLARAYLIDDASQLLSLDLVTGEATPLAAFPIVEGEAREGSGGPYRNYVAATPGTIIVYLGDTYQLFALRVIRPD